MVKTNAKNPAVQFAIQKLYDKMKVANYGTLFKWEEISCIINDKKLTHRQIYHVGIQVNALLMVYDQRVAETVYRVGKKIANPREHGRLARSKVRQSTKKYIDAGKIIAATNMEYLSKEEQEQIKIDATKYATLQAFTSELLKTKKLPKKTKTTKEQLVFDVLKYLRD